MKMSPFDFILLPADLMPGVDIDGNSKEKNKFDQSGYEIKVSIYLIGILAA